MGSITYDTLSKSEDESENFFVMEVNSFGVKLVTQIQTLLFKSIYLMKPIYNNLLTF
jgi:hypothetical protein